MKVWIERCEQSGHGISWEGVALLVKTTHRNGAANLTQREIDLAYGLKDKQEIILMNHSIFFGKLHIDVHIDFFLYGINMHLIINIESLCNIFVYGLLEVKHHKAMMCNGCRYHIKKLDETKKTSDCGISTIFEVTSVSYRSDRHPKLSENRYYGYMEDILQCEFNSFKVVLFVFKWYRL